MDLMVILTDLIQNYGLFGLFIGAVIANASLFFVIPIDVFVFAFGSTFNPFLIALIGGLGATIGELTSYIVGLGGRTALKRFGKPMYDKVLSIEQKLEEKHGMLVIILGAFSPFPFDIIGIAAGLTRFDIFKFFIATYIGKFIRYFLIAVAGMYGFEIVKGLFGF